MEDNNQVGQESTLQNEVAQETTSQSQVPQATTLQNEVPQAIKKWNWGAFMFNILWGIGNNSYLPLLCLIPLFNIIWVFVCGAKGNEWAWKKGSFASEEEFLKIQKSWNRAGIASFIIGMSVVVIYVLFFATLVGAAVQYGL